MTDLVKFLIPASYVLDHSAPTLAELVYGYRHSWLSAADTVVVAMSRFEANESTLPAEEELALLRPMEVDQVAGLVWSLEQAITPLDDGASRLWLFLAMAWVWDHRAAFSDPLGTVDMIYTDFDYPAEIEGLIRYLPPPPGAEPGIPALHDRWREYVEQQTRQFRAHRTA